MLVSGLSYGVWQGRFLIMGPEIIMGAELPITQGERVVLIEGQAENATKLFLNGRPILTDEAGNFIEGVVLENGHSVVAIDAYDRYGRVTRWEQAFVYVDAFAEDTVAKR